MFLLESPHGGDSNEYTQYTIFNIKKKITQIIRNLQLWDVYKGTQKRVRNSRGKRAISVRATEVLLYMYCDSGRYLRCQSSLNPAEIPEGKNKKKNKKKKQQKNKKQKKKKQSPPPPKKKKNNNN